jgi:hypothetical protein
MTSNKIKATWNVVKGGTGREWPTHDITLVNLNNREYNVSHLIAGDFKYCRLVADKISFTDEKSDLLLYKKEIWKKFLGINPVQTVANEIYKIIYSEIKTYLYTMEISLFIMKICLHSISMYTIQLTCLIIWWKQEIFQSD